MRIEEVIEKIESYEQVVKDYGYEPEISEEDINNSNDILSNIPEKYKKDIKLLNDNDFSNFNNLPYYLRNLLGALAVKEFVNNFSDISTEDVNVQKYLREKAMNPVFRAGIAAGRENNALKARLDAYMNNYLLEKTLLPPTESEKKEITDKLGEIEAQKVLKENLAKQRVIAKSLFIFQLGQYIVKSSSHRDVGYLGLISETIAHGGRTNVVLPHGGDQSAVMNAFISEQTTKDANVYKRTAASHAVKRMEIIENGMAIIATKETSPSLFQYFSNHYGMDFATGGIGKIGPNKKVILPDGASGHLYIRKEEGDEKCFGSLLIGFESSAPSTTSYTGHKHDFRAKSAKHTSFLASKGGVGRNVDGRVVDLSGLKPEEFISLMNAFDKKYEQLQNKANTQEGIEELENFNKILCGNRLKNDELINFLKDYDLANENQQNIVSKARGGLSEYETKFNPNIITRERVEDFYREKISTEEACRMANTRFNRAIDCNTAVNAIKELQKIHNTRSWLWTIFHPINNYRENKTINNLIKDLYNYKNLKLYTPQEVYNAFTSTEDTYLFDYGIGLKNHEGVALIERYMDSFLKSDKHTEAMNEQFVQLGKKAKSIVNELRMSEEERQRQYEFLTRKNKQNPINKNEISDQNLSKKIMDSDVSDIKDRGDIDYAMMTKEALLYNVVSQGDFDDKVMDIEIDNNNEKEPLIIEEETSFLDNEANLSKFINNGHPQKEEKNLIK